MTSLTQIAVPFHNAELYIVEYEGQPYTPMKPIVDGMGLDWKSQFVKLKQRFSSTVVEITIVANDGKERLMTCLPVKKLFGWLMTISPNKVKPELRDTVIKYQEECDDVLWDYWTKGKAVNPRPKTHKSERTPLHDAHAMLVAKTKHLSSSDAWKIINQRFGTEHIEDIPYEAIPVAVEYVHHLIALYSSAGKQASLFDKDTYELIRQLAEAIILENDEIVPVLMAVKIIDEKKFAYYAHKVVRANESAKKVSRILDFRNNLNEPLIDVNCKVIALSTGQRFMARPNWFNCPS